MKMDFGWQINIYGVIGTFHSVIAMLAAGAQSIAPSGEHCNDRKIFDDNRIYFFKPAS